MDTTPRARVTTTRRKPQRTVPLPVRCQQAAPCGDKCCLDGNVRHELHSCKDAECEDCHGAERFGRVGR